MKILGLSLCLFLLACPLLHAEDGDTIRGFFSGLFGDTKALFVKHSEDRKTLSEVGEDFRDYIRGR